MTATVVGSYGSRVDRLAFIDDPWHMTLRPRLVVLVVPSVLLLIAVLRVQEWWYAGVALVALTPWLANLAGLCTQRSARLLVWVPICAVAGMMTQWRKCDFALMLLVYLAGEAGVLLSGRWAVPAVLVACLAVPVAWAIGDGYPQSFSWIVGIAFACACGTALRWQRRTMNQLRAVQHELAAQAVTEERRRIAREVHDLAAHSMAVTVLHLTGARLALADGEIDEASGALAAAEALGRTSMSEIRQAVGALSEPGDPAVTTPMPDGRDVPALLASYRDAGMLVESAVTGRDDGVDAATGLVVFRAVQESLANAARHAPGAPVYVRLRWPVPTTGGLSIALTVSNPIEPAGADATAAGSGLIGMRERVERLGGTMTAGPSEGDWCVEIRLPGATASAGCHGRLSSAELK